MSEENKARSSYLDLDEIQKAFDEWALERMACFKTSGLLDESYRIGYIQAMRASRIKLSEILRAQACSRDANYYAAVEQGKP